MNEILIYLLKSSIVLSILHLFFVLFLQKETFHSFNRWILLGIILLSLFLPACTTPEWLSNLGQVLFPPNTSAIPLENISETPGLSSTNPVTSPAPASSISASSKLPFTINWKGLLVLGYLLGVTIFICRFFAQLLSVIALMLMHPRERKDGFLFVYPSNLIAPFSFFKAIFIGKNDYPTTILDQIISHEKIHATQRHTWDILWAEVLIVFQWFNPLAWRHRRTVEMNLEYLVDQEILNNGTNPKSYQYSLLKVAVPNYPITLATNYNSSRLKQRIIMMQQKKSSFASSWKYLLFLPLSLVIWMAFGTPSFKIGDVYFLNIITNQATEAEINMAKSKLYNEGIDLIINQLDYGENDQIKNLNVSYVMGVSKNCSSAMLDLVPGAYIMFERTNHRSHRCGSYLSEKNLDEISVNNRWNKILINGKRPTPKEVKELVARNAIIKEKAKAKRNEVLKEKFLKGEDVEILTSNNGYNGLNNKIVKQINQKINDFKAPVFYYVDGKQVDHYEIKAEEVKSVDLNKQMSNQFDINGNLTISSPSSMHVMIITKSPE